METPTKQAQSLRNRVFAKRAELNQLVGKFDASDLRIFGSVARGDESEGSDIDLLVHVNTPYGYLRRTAFIREVNDLLEHRTDLVFDDTLKPEIRNNILAGRIISL